MIRRKPIADTNFKVLLHPEQVLRILSDLTNYCSVLRKAKFKS